jgi:tRNA (guanosine-2'-O-)-methyltransferase
VILPLATSTQQAIDHADLHSFLRQFVSEERLQAFHKVLAKRTRHIAVVVEDVYQPHNASAVLRSCDCFGIQDVHIIENRNAYHVSPGVTKGASKWLSLHRYRQEGGDNTRSCITKLKSDGYHIVATSPHATEIGIGELDLSKKIALVFGNEAEGISQSSAAMADSFVTVPMLGFTESFNISVAAAICLYEVRSRLEKECANWRLSDEELATLEIEWMKKSIRNSEGIIKNYYGQASGN